VIRFDAPSLKKWFTLPRGTLTFAIETTRCDGERVKTNRYRGCKTPCICRVGNEHNESFYHVIGQKPSPSHLRAGYGVAGRRSSKRWSCESRDDVCDWGAFVRCGFSCGRGNPGSALVWPYWCDGGSAFVSSCHSYPLAIRSLPARRLTFNLFPSPAIYPMGPIRTRCPLR